MKPPGGMRPRDPAEPHRVATPLELLFDLCFVVAVAQASAHLHHGLSAARWGETLAPVVVATSVAAGGVE